MTSSYDELVLSSTTSTAEAVLKLYDPVMRSWRIPFSGDFWHAVWEAHDAGLTGKGKTVAVIDTCPDMAIPIIAERVEKVMPGDTGSPHAHGTVVCLMVLETAPDTRILHFDIGEQLTNKDGETYVGINHSRVKAALAHTRLAGVDVICMSNGHPRSDPNVIANPDDINTLEELYAEPAVDPLVEARRRRTMCSAPMAQSIKCDTAFCYCEAIRKIPSNAVFCAPAGNSAVPAWCPALDPRTVSVGYQTVLLTNIGGSQIADWMPPKYHQAGHVDYTLEQTVDPERSSFATPLFAGAMAIRDGGALMHHLLLPHRIARPAQRYEFQIERALKFGDKTNLPFEKLAETLDKIYELAIAAMPAVNTAKRTNTEMLEARLFHGSFLTNWGYYILRCHADALSLKYSKLAAELQPYSPHPHANAGKAYLDCAKTVGAENGMSEKRVRVWLDQAATYYDKALSCLNRNEDELRTYYTNERRIIEEMRTT